MYLYNAKLMIIFLPRGEVQRISFCFLEGGGRAASVGYKCSGNPDTSISQPLKTYRLISLWLLLPLPNSTDDLLTSLRLLLICIGLARSRNCQLYFLVQALLLLKIHPKQSKQLL